MGKIINKISHRKTTPLRGRFSFDFFTNFGDNQIYGYLLTLNYLIAVTWGLTPSYQ